MDYRLYLILLLIIPGVMAETLTEDFESFYPSAKPDQEWYNYSEGANIGNVSEFEGEFDFLVSVAANEQVSSKFSRFTLGTATQITQTTFTINGLVNTEQVISIDSVSPIRSIVQFYVFCSSDANPNGCELRVKFDQADSTGQVLIPYTNDDMEFDIDLTFNWIDFQFCLFVDGVDDGCFDFLQLPTNVSRITFSQYRGDVALGLRFDDWVIEGGINGTAQALEGDFAEGMQDFSTNLKFTTDGSKLAFGIVLFVIMIAAVVVPAFTLGKTNTIAPALAFYSMLVVSWLIQMEYWPNWIEIFAIIIVSGLIGLILRRMTLGISNANTGPSLIAGSLGYFIICAAFLGFAGYQTESISIPTGSPVEQDPAAVDQSFIGAVTECIVTGGVFTFGLVGDCDQSTVSTTWKTITDIFSWVQAGLNYLFQLLTFQLPIPVLFNIMIVLPPAATLMTYAIEVIRGK